MVREEGQHANQLDHHQPLVSFSKLFILISCNFNSTRISHGTLEGTFKAVHEFGKPLLISVLHLGCIQCDQIGRFFAIWATIESIWQQNFAQISHILCQFS